VGFDAVFRAEMQVILGVDLAEGTTAAALDDTDTDLSALCLSGGGIRSATFALGVMQGLARFDLLRHFHYLSSVSGGGYIASWLSAWRHRVSDDVVFKALNISMATGQETPELTGIRADSNYLTPQMGLLSADTWTVIALYIRNLLLNWLLFVPFFMGCFIFPRLCVAILSSVASVAHFPNLFHELRLAGAAFTTFGLACSIYGRFCRQGQWLTDARFRLLALLPLVTSGALFTIAAVAESASTDAPSMMAFSAANLGTGAAWGAAVYFLAWLAGRSLSLPVVDPTERKIEPLDVAFWTLCGALVGLLSTMGMIGIASGILSSDSTDATRVSVILGLSGFVLAYLIGELFYVGLASFSRKGDMDREWLARSSGWLSAVAVGWAMFSAVSLYAPDALRYGWNGLVAAVAGGASGLVTLILGSSGLTAATKAAQTLKSVPLMRLAAAAAIIFAILIASLLSLLDQQLESVLLDHDFPFLRTTVGIDVCLMIVLIGIAVLLSTCINVNRFSMHALYANRLIRAFLGSARVGDRKPDPFTGFDPKDNLRLAATEPQVAGDKLFHVINATLNVVSSKNRAWQERKAEPFTMSRLYCGNPYVHYRRTATYGGKDKGGLTLGTAMAISGAAVSPNQGYNSSPLIGFLLMLFNVRLGWWLGSPKAAAYSLEGPRLSLSPALRELAGDTTDDSQWIYLSDGGHFENLGLYEMVRRRCRMIVVSDAGCDPTCSFEDLGNAVRKIFIDFGVSIEFEQLQIQARQTPPVPGLRFAIGSIKYPGSTRLGWLLYLKPTYQGTERADVRSYATGHPTFPHESTTDQWFSESQLESYRALGASITEYICSGGAGVDAGTTPEPLTLEGLKKVVADLLSTHFPVPPTGR
jgi:Patatin-like phospholipase